jgi:hypothetical protein
MGVYDYVKTQKCPKCEKPIGYNKDGSPIGDTQTKDFVFMRVGNCMTERDKTNCFRTFTEGTECGCFPKNGCLLLSNPCYHCMSKLVVMFQDGILIKIDIAPELSPRPDRMELFLNGYRELCERQATQEEKDAYQKKFQKNPPEFDYFVGECPTCHEIFKDLKTDQFCSMREGQEYVGDHDIRVFTIGTQNGCFPMNACFCLNDECPHCKKTIVAIFNDGVLSSFDTI